MEPQQSGTAPNARAVAFNALGRVLEKGRTVDEAFATDETDRLDERDRAFARLLVLTTLRRLGQIDAVIDTFVVRPMTPKRPAVRNLLRLGVCQLLFLGTPPHAAVDSMVTLASEQRLRPFKGLVNAVLRRAAREGPALIADQDEARLNTPHWLWLAWQAAYGDEACRNIAASHISQPPLDITVKAEPERWANELGAKRLPTGSLRLARYGKIEALPGYAQGAWWVQDAAAALPVRMLGDVRGTSIIEIGAAPGGKTAQLLASGAHVVALDRAKGRIARLRENLARIGLSAEVVEADATAWRPETLADAVLLDAPCSAIGTIRRHPEIPWLRGPEDVSRLSATQRVLLAAACDMVKPGGLMVYAACSLQPEECEDQIERLLESRGNFERIAVAPDEIGGLRDLITAAGDLRTLPSHCAMHGGMDGFYAARLRRLA